MSGLSDELAAEIELLQSMYPTRITSRDGATAEERVDSGTLLVDISRIPLHSSSKPGGLQLHMQVSSSHGYARCDIVFRAASSFPCSTHSPSKVVCGSISSWGGSRDGFIPLAATDVLDIDMSHVTRGLDDVVIHQLRASLPALLGSDVSLWPIIAHLTEKMDAVEEHLQCIVCLSPLLTSTLLQTLPCGHVFHEDCVFRWCESVAETYRRGEVWMSKQKYYATIVSNAQGVVDEATRQFKHWEARKWSLEADIREVTSCLAAVQAMETATNTARSTAMGAMGASVSGNKLPSKSMTSDMNVGMWEAKLRSCEQSLKAHIKEKQPIASRLARSNEALTDARDIACTSGSLGSEGTAYWRTLVSECPFTCPACRSDIVSLPQAQAQAQAQACSHDHMEPKHTDGKIERGVIPSAFATRLVEWFTRSTPSSRTVATPTTALLASDTDTTGMDARQAMEVKLYVDSFRAKYAAMYEKQASQGGLLTPT
jgi:hypothetical protein